MRRPAPAYAAALNEGAVIADLNMTPLIDVLLVLIVMFILLVPAITNEVPITLPHGDVSGPQVTHRLEVARAGALLLDGVGVNEAGLAAPLTALAGKERAALVMRADPAARYARFVEVLAVVKRAGVTRLGFEGLAEMGR